MKLKTLSFFLCTTLLAGFATTTHADVHVGIGIGVAPPIVVSPPPVYYTPPPVYYAPSPPPVYYGPGIVVGTWGGHDWRDHGGHDERWRHDRGHDHGERRR